MPSMNPITSTTGRPTSRIDGARLEALRRECCLSRLALATKVYELAGRGQTDAKVMENSAARWATKGTVQVSLIGHLAAALGTTVAVLKGASPTPAHSRLDDLEKCINARVAQGPSPELTTALNDCQDEASPVRALAEHITTRLEAAQLSQDQEEFKKLEGLTKLGRKELNKPNGHEGFWMLIGTGVPGPERSEILRGVFSIVHAVMEEMEKFLTPLHESDAHVAFSRETHWFRVTLHHARVPRWTRTLRFARCQPDERGLQWVSPTWQDEYWLHDLPQRAYESANFVTGFDGIRVPADCTRLGFAVTRNPSPQETEESTGDARPQVVARTVSDMNALPPELVTTRMREGQAHALVVDRLTSGLWEHLQPWLDEWPLDCWSFRPAAARIDVMLEVPYRLHARSAMPPRAGHLLSVNLVERSTDGRTQPAPWRRGSVEVVVESLEKSRQAALSSQAHSPSSISA